MCYPALEGMGIKRVRTEVSVSYLDHNPLYVNTNTPDDHIFLTSIARKYGIWLSRPGNGIMHSVQYARFGIGLTLPQGYDTPAGEAGKRLSGGEKQRIAIARMLLKNAPIVILDEATASIDPENEHLIQSALSELTPGKTIITIAHRLATIEQADQILVVDDGRIVEKGTHAQLIAQPGRYQQFVRIREKAEGWKL